VADRSKRVERLAAHTPVPVEVLPFGWRRTCQLLFELGCEPLLRGGEGRPLLTDNGNYLLDCHLGQGVDLHAWAAAVAGLPGVLEHGLFLDEARLAFVAGPSTAEVAKLERSA